jgi:uncharacterized cupin superfamily protein
MLNIAQSLLPQQLAEALGISALGRRPELQVFSASEAQMAQAPEEQFASIRVLDGNPRMRALQLAVTPDDKLASGMWDCSAGKIEVTYLFDEIIHVLEGEVHVDVNGSVRTLRAGEVAMFPMGLYTVWEIPNYVRKIWIMRYPQRSLVQRATGKVVNTLRKLQRSS